MRECLRRTGSESVLREIGRQVAAARGRDRLPLDELSEQVREAVREFADREVAPEAERIHRRDALVPESFITKMAELGYFGLAVPEAYGGSELGNLAMILAPHRRSVPGRQHRRRSRGKNNVYLATYQLGCSVGHLRRTRSQTVLDDEVLAFDKALFAHSLPKAVNERSRWRSNTQEADAPDLACLLRPRRERPHARRCRAAEKRDELAPLQVSPSEQRSTLRAGGEKQPASEIRPMSALGHKRTFCDAGAMSALPPIADMGAATSSASTARFARR